MDNYDNTIFTIEPSEKYFYEALSKLVDDKKIKGKTIVLKPNIRSIHPVSKARNTNPMVVENVLKFFKNNYDNKCIVCDSSVIGIDTIEAAKVSGIYEVCERYSTEFVDIKQLPFSKHETAIEPNIIEISDILLNEIYLVNIPKLKTTYATPVSLSIKNLKGLISDQSKKDFHQYGLDSLLAELKTMIRPDLNIIDGVISLSLQTPINTNLVILSTLYAELDASISEDLGIGWRNINYLKHIFNDSDPFLNLNKITLGNPTKFSSFKLETADKKMITKYPNVLLLSGSNPCSGCLGCIQKALDKVQTNKKIIIITGFMNEEENILLDRINKDTLKEERVIINIGNCSAKKYTLGNKVFGCPPTIDKIKKIIF